jgi:hypothetical protein
MVLRRKAEPLNQTKLPSLHRVNLNSHRADLSKPRLLQTLNRSSCLKRHKLDRSLDILDPRDSPSMVCRASRFSNPASRASQ